MKPIRVLFVCHGNICRSVMAEYMFKKMVHDLGLEDHYEIASAATSTEEIGCDIYPPAKRKLKEHGIPFDRHYARQVTKKDYQYYDKLICMDSNNMYNIHRMMEDKDKKISMLLERSVADPWYTGDFETTYRDILEGLKKLV